MPLTPGQAIQKAALLLDRRGDWESAEATLREALQTTSAADAAGRIGLMLFLAELLADRDQAAEANTLVGDARQLLSENPELDDVFGHDIRLGRAE